MNKQRQARLVSCRAKGYIAILRCLLFPPANHSFFAIDAYGIGHSDDHWPRFLIHVEAKYGGPRIVPHDIKVELPSCDVSHVQVRPQDTFTRKVGTGEHLPQGIDNTTATTRKDGL